MDAIGLRIQLRELPFQDMAKELVAGKYQMLHGYSLGWISAGLHHVYSSLWKGAAHDQSLAICCVKRLLSRRTNGWLGSESSLAR